MQDEQSHGKESSTRSVMFDLELSHKGKETGGTEGSFDTSTVGTGSSPAIQRVRYLARPVASFELDLLQDVGALSASLEETYGRVPLALLASDLSVMGYRCSIQCVESPSLPDTSNYGREGEVEGAKCLELLRHEFLLCSGRLDGSSDHQCLIDPQFRDQFSLGKHNKEYEKLLEVVPQVFVGSPLRLQSLAAVICSEMAKMHKELGISLPPWRRPHAVLGKWFDTSGGMSPTVASDVNQGGMNQLKPPGVQPQKGMKKNTTFFGLFRMHKETIQSRRTKSSEVDVVNEKSNKPHRRQMVVETSVQGPQELCNNTSVSLLARGLMQSSAENK